MSAYEPLPSFPEESSDHRGQLEAPPELATWTQRVGAYLLDGVLVFALATIAAAATGHHDIFNTFKFRTVNGKQQVVPYGSKLDFFLVAEGALSLVYSVGFLASSWQATLGMRLLRIRIARETDLGPVGVGRAAGRSVVVLGAYSALQLVLRFVAGLVILVDLLWPLWDSRNQTLHDKVARTVVLRRAPVS
jgi:uncharacterized RDD family membrane protein YckC